MRPITAHNQSLADRYARFAGSRRKDQPSYLHCILVSTIVQCFFIIQFLVPYAKLFLEKVYRYERSHRIIERVATATLDAADSLGKGSVNLGSAVMGFIMRRVGAAVSGFALWWFEGMAGGIYEGVRRGMVILGTMRPNVPI
jgi:hypothetical protein